MDLRKLGNFKKVSEIFGIKDKFSNGHAKIWFYNESPSFLGFVNSSQIFFSLMSISLCRQKKHVKTKLRTSSKLANFLRCLRNIACGKQARTDLIHFVRFFGCVILLARPNGHAKNGLTKPRNHWKRCSLFFIS